MHFKQFQNNIKVIYSLLQYLVKIELKTLNKMIIVIILFYQKRKYINLNLRHILCRKMIN